MKGLATLLLSLTAARLPPPAAEWLAAAARKRDCDLPGSFAQAGRRAGLQRLGPSQAEAAALAEAGLCWSTRGWSVGDAARAALLLGAASRMPQGRLGAVVADLYRYGDAREQAALMRCLELLPCPQAWLSLARQAVRGGIPLVVEALARDNPYPARHFPDQALEHLARRAAALGVEPEQVWSLERRRAARRTAALEPS